MLLFAHIFHSTLQDSSAVVAVMSDVISQLKIIMPELSRQFIIVKTMLGVITAASLWCVYYNPWPPVAPRFFRSARRQDRRCPEGSNN